MSEDTRPPTRGLHSHATAGIGVRAARLRGRGSEYARLVWLAILGHTKWPGRRPGPTWASNQTLAEETGIDLTNIEVSLQRLREAGMLATPIGQRPGARRPIGRVLVPQLGAPCKVLIPDRHEMAQLWARCRAFRRRPCAAVTAMVGAYALACDANRGQPIDEWTRLVCSQAAWRRFVGAGKGAAWYALVADLERAGLIRRRGKAIDVSPPRSWIWTLADFDDQDRRDHGPAPPIAA